MAVVLMAGQTGIAHANDRQLTHVISYELPRVQRSIVAADKCRWCLARLDTATSLTYRVRSDLRLAAPSSSRGRSASYWAYGALTDFGSATIWGSSAYRADYS